MADRYRLQPFALEKRDFHVDDAAAVRWPLTQPHHLFVYHLWPLSAPARIGLGERVFEPAEDLSAAELGPALYALCGGIPGIDELRAQCGADRVIHRADQPELLVLRPTEAGSVLPPVAFSALAA